MTHDVLFHLEQLKELIIQHSTGIDFKASVLASIDLIDMTNSTVHSISSIFDPLPVMLKEINFSDISSQKTSKLILESPDEGQSMAMAQRITMVQCLLNSVAVKNMPLLVSLNLSKNSLSESSVELVNLPALVTLVLSHNEFDRVSQSLLPVESPLNTIDLSHNRISYLDSKAFEVVHSLRMVNLSHNLLFNMGSFQPHPRLDSIEIDSNPWDCAWLNHSRLKNPTFFNILRYHKRYDTLSVWGLPCLLPTTATTKFPSQFDPEQRLPTIHEPFMSYPEGKIMPLGKKISIYQPRFTIAKPLKVIISIAAGVLVSNVIILLYNRYRNILREPFYRYLSKSLSVGDGVTEKSTSFWYEVPVSNDANAIPLNNIYEEICEAGPHRDIYDALNFQRDEQQQVSSDSASVS
ncbi:uncharacterized protein LOC128713146 [Anopheles marshallii]|uniref:uncharacterized protein LOC128713146 n=1 Tax=Anopheles marshallii TaxID=1521116 RepID=UPI00237BAAA0|nr:uncharacterized protein LOC128713146 [Anopheles marshallii]